MDSTYLIWFSVAWIVILYLFNALIAKRWQKIEPKKLFTYVTTLIVLGVFGEVFIDSIYMAIVGEPFWVYRVLPIHHEFTSYYSIVIWGIFGFHLYLFHDTLARSKRKLQDWQLACIFAFEAVLLEIAINLSHIAIKNEYAFYYLPPDLWHLTSLLALPLYFLGGYVTILVLKRFSKDPFFFGIISIVAVFVLVFLT